jgi:flagellar biosynthesis/type III secretory pathway M-ring protein FliF/YscJ
MECLKKVGDPVTLQILCDALQEKGISFRVDNAGMNALLPVPGLMDARVMVAEEDITAAELVLVDLNLEGRDHD